MVKHTIILQILEYYFTGLSLRNRVSYAHLRLRVPNKPMLTVLRNSRAVPNSSYPGLNKKI